MFSKDIFLEPTGDYAVGTTSYHFIDSDREETYTENPNDRREITAKVWYPSVEVPEADSEDGQSANRVKLPKFVGAEGRWLTNFEQVSSRV